MPKIQLHKTWGFLACCQWWKNTQHLNCDSKRCFIQQTPAECPLLPSDLMGDLLSFISKLPDSTHLALSQKNPLELCRNKKGSNMATNIRGELVKFCYLRLCTTTVVWQQKKVYTSVSYTLYIIIRTAVDEWIPTLDTKMFCYMVT